MTQLVSFDTAAQFVRPNADPEDLTFQNLVLAVSTAIEQYLGSNPRRGTHAELVDSNGGTRFYVRNVPIVNVTRVAHDPMHEFSVSTDLDPVLWTFDDESVFLRAGVRLAPGFRSVRIEYESGYWVPGVDLGYDPLEASLPAPIIEATLRTIAALSNIGPSEAVQSESAGDVAYARASGPIPLDPYVQMLLSPYRRVFV